MSDTRSGALGAGGQDSPRSEVEWRRLPGRLWAGRRDDFPIGTVESGRRYTFVDVDGVAHPGYRTLRDAEDAALSGGGPPRAASTRGAAVPPRRRAALATASSVLVLGAVGVVVGWLAR